MGFIAAQTVIFWSVSPFLVILVSAPLFTLNLYQRSSVRGRAVVAALTSHLNRKSPAYAAVAI